LATNEKARKTDAIAATPDASPSMLSSRLMAFVIPMSQKTVIAMLTGGDCVHGKESP
jgi:hypothetical protein